MMTKKHLTIFNKKTKLNNLNKNPKTNSTTLKKEKTIKNTMITKKTENNLNKMKKKKNFSTVILLT